MCLQLKVTIDEQGLDFVQYGVIWQQGQKESASSALQAVLATQDTFHSLEISSRALKSTSNLLQVHACELCT